MLFSYIFNVSIVSTIVNVFVSTASTSLNEIKIGLLYTGINILLMFGINKIGWIRKGIDKIIMKIANRNALKRDNFISIYDVYGTKVIAEVEVKTLHEEIEGKTIKESELKNKYGIQLLVVKRAGEVNTNVASNTIIQENDHIIVFGKLKDIKELFLKKPRHKLETTIKE